MKLAEALIEKKNLAARITELQGRYTAAAVIEEGAEPDEVAEDLLQSLNAAFEQWEDLTVKINVANNAILVGDKTMMQSLAHRDSLKTQISHFNAIASAIRQRNQSRRYYNENGPKMVVAEGVSAKTFIKLVDDLSKELRLLDAAIQAANWANELTA
jgi:molybdopterin converting factor small subunit